MRDLAYMKREASATSVLIKWKGLRKPRSGYHVSYQAIKSAALPVSNAVLRKVELNQHSTRIQITGLESITTYKVTVTPIARNGKLMKSAYVFAGTFCNTKTCFSVAIYVLIVIFYSQSGVD